MQLKITEEGQAPIIVAVQSPEVSAVVTIGRREDNDVVLTQSFVSGQHARLFAGSYLEDRRSRNGTFVDGKRIDRPTLLAGRPFTLGGQTLTLQPVFQEEDGLAASMAAAVTELSNGGSGSRPRGAALAAEDESALLGSLVAEDFEKMVIPANSTATDHYIYEAFRFIRNAERIVSKIAGGLTKELSHKTVLPDADKNFRAHMAALMVQKHDAATRADLHAYLNTVFEWLYAAVHCYQKASMAVVEELRSEIDQAALQRQGSIPWHARLRGLERAVLWDRAEARLENWTQSHVIERLEAQVSSAAKVFRLAKDFDDL